MQIKESKIFDMVAGMAAGMYANPCNGMMAQDQYNRQQVMNGLFLDIQNFIAQNGIEVIKDE